MQLANRSFITQLLSSQREGEYSHWAVDTKAACVGNQGRSKLGLASLPSQCAWIRPANVDKWLEHFWNPCYCPESPAGHGSQNCPSLGHCPQGASNPSLGCNMHPVATAPHFSAQTPCQPLTSPSLTLQQRWHCILHNYSFWPHFWYYMGF